MSLSLFQALVNALAATEIGQKLALTAAVDANLACLRPHYIPNEIVV